MPHSRMPAPTPPNSPLIKLLRGVDGCRAGWLVLSRRAPQEPAPWRQVEASLVTEASALEAGAAVAITAIDIPIGLADGGPRCCDQEARRRLGPRRSSVFPAPPRPVLDASDHRQACEMSRALDGRGLSVQTWNIMPKVRQVDTLLRQQPALVPQVQEVHPELAFLAWNSGNPLGHGKRCREGRAERLALCEREFPGAWASVRARFRRSDVADDDILDALALLRSAARLWRGEATVLPQGPTPRDACGLPMTIAF
jgi:predicted RNase H-like nuclease